MDHFQSLLQFVTILLLFYVLVFGCEACGILSPQPGTVAPALDGRVFSTGSPASPCIWAFEEPVQQAQDCGTKINCFLLTGTPLFYSEVILILRKVMKQERVSDMIRTEPTLNINRPETERTGGGRVKTVAVERATEKSQRGAQRGQQTAKVFPNLEKPLHHHCIGKTMIKHDNMEFTILTIFKCKVWWHWTCCQIKGRINRERKAEDRDRERLLLQVSQEISVCSSQALSPSPD